MRGIGFSDGDFGWGRLVSFIEVWGVMNLYSSFQGVHVFKMITFSFTDTKREMDKVFSYSDSVFSLSDVQ